MTIFQCKRNIIYDRGQWDAFVLNFMLEWGLGGGGGSLFLMTFSSTEQPQKGIGGWCVWPSNASNYNINDRFLTHTFGPNGGNYFIYHYPTQTTTTTNNKRRRAKQDLTTGKNHHDYFKRGSHYPIKEGGSTH